LQYDSVYHNNITKIQGIQHAAPYLTSSAVISFGQEVEGVIAKGIEPSSNIPFLTHNIQFKSNDAYEIILSEALAKKLLVSTHDEIRLYTFSNAEITNRKFKVIGLYHSGMDDYDLQYVMMPLLTLQKINNQLGKIDGYTIITNTNSASKEVVKKLNGEIPENAIAASLEDITPQIFDWIGVQSTNRNVTITILLIIAIVNLITCLLILILERVNMIGSLISMGATNHQLRQIFLFQASFIAWLGIGIGAVIGIGLCFLQIHFQFIHLDESAYFISTLPIYIKWDEVLYVLLGTAIISYTSFMLPSLWIKKINPSKAIRFQ
jgi:lipoprotein-releasing system permease protein